LPFKGHVIADQNLHSIFEMIDDSIEMSSDTLKERQARCMHVRSNFPKNILLLGLVSMTSISFCFGKGFKIEDEDKAFAEASSKGKLIAYVLG